MIRRDRNESLTHWVLDTDDAVWATSKLNRMIAMSFGRSQSNQFARTYWPASTDFLDGRNIRKTFVYIHVYRSDRPITIAEIHDQFPTKNPNPCEMFRMDPIQNRLVYKLENHVYRIHSSLCTF